MGAVYLARDTRLGRAVALKLLLARFTQEPDRVQRFRQEARAVSRLNHPNILTVYEVGEVDGVHYLAAEYVAGETVRALSGERLKLGVALDWMIQVAGALSGAHRAGIVHRDIKPENLMVRPDGYVKVLDFGVAKLTEQSGSASFVKVRTPPGAVMGTVAYMSPEQARGLEIDARSDLFSLGVVFYELLTGRQPFEGETASDRLAALLRRDPPPLDRYLPGLPPKFQQIIDRALAKSAADRYSTAAELLAELRELKTELEFSSQQAAPASKAPGRAAVLTMEIGRRASPSDGRDQFAATTGEMAGQSTARLALWFGYLRRRRTALALALSVAALIAVGVWFGGRWRDLFGASGRKIDSIAVLPFVNAGQDTQREYLPDGITESLIRSLSEFQGLSVTAGSTVFTYKGKQVDPRRLGVELAVGAVVTGRVGQLDSRLRVGVELIDTTDGSQIWSEQYDRPVVDLHSLQQEIAGEISRQLRMPLNSAERQRPARRETGNIEAQYLYMQGRYLWNKRTSEALRKSIEAYKGAIARDPDYAEAYAGLTAAYAVLPSYTDASPRAAAAEAKAAAAEALGRDPQLAEAHAALGLVLYTWDWDRGGAERAFRRAITINPSYAIAHRWYSLLLTTQGRFDEAIVEAGLACRLDPVTTGNHAALGETYFYAGRYDEALRQYEKWRDLDGTNRVGLNNHLGVVYIEMGRYEEAITAFREAMKAGDETEAPALLGCTYVRAGRRREAMTLLAELERSRMIERVWRVPLAELYAALGNKEQAFDSLERALERREEPITRLKVNPRLGPLRSDPRFADILRRIGVAR